MQVASSLNPVTPFTDIKLFHSNLKMPIVQLPLTTSLITLSQGTILLSPHPSLTPAEFASMGNVTDIVAPNLFHHLGINGAIAAFPEAKLWGSAGLEQKRKDLNWDAFLDASNWPYQAELVAINIAGNPKINEFVFFHPKSQTLFVIDLCFNILDDRGFGGWLLYNLFGTYKHLGVSKFYTKFVTDKAAFQQSLATLFSYDFEHIVVCHGAIVQGEGRAKLRAALAERGVSA
jgi:hypothetical protein